MKTKRAIFWVKSGSSTLKFRHLQICFFLYLIAGPVSISSPVVVWIIGVLFNVVFYLWNFVCSADFNAFCEFVVLGRNKLDMSWFCICLMTIWRECHWILMSVLFWTCSKVRWDAALTQRHWKYFCLNSQSDEDKTSCFWGNLVQSFKFGLLQTRFFLHLNSEFVSIFFL